MDWKHYLAQQGASFTPGDNEILHFGTPVSLAEATSGFAAPLTDLGLIAAHGEEAASFLHSQLTNDIQHLGNEEVRLAGYCSAKGRLLATFVAWRHRDAYYLQLPVEILAAIQKRLQMYVLRAKVKLEAAGQQYVAIGIGGQNAPAALANWFPNLPTAPYTKVEEGENTLIRVADGFGSPCYQCIVPIEIAQQMWEAFGATLRPAGTHVWRLAQIAAGIPQIASATQEKFVPQMINYEVVGGVNFKKGCYPGQEIVARTQYLGKLKRRMVLASVPLATAAAGMEVYSSADPGQPCGMVVNAAPNWSNGADCLIEIKLEALQSSAVTLNDLPLQFIDLPYTV